MLAARQCGSSQLNVRHTILPYLRRTHEVSRYKERWQVIKVAISDKDQVLDFYTSGPELGPYDGLSDTGRGGAASKVAVIGKRLDTVLDGLGRPPVSLVKIDIEGGEWEAIKGAEALISACRPYIIFEWNVENLRAYNRSAEDIFAIAPERYDIYTLPNLAPLNPSVLSLELMRTEMFLLAPVLPLARSQTIMRCPVLSELPAPPSGKLAGPGQLKVGSCQMLCPTVRRGHASPSSPRVIIKVSLSRKRYVPFFFKAIPTSNIL